MTTDVTDAANVTAAGAVMDSELTNESAVKNIDQELTTTSSVTFNGLDVGNLNLDSNTISSTDTDGNIVLSPNGDGLVVEVVDGTEYPIVSQRDIGTDPNQIPLNSSLGDLATGDNSSDISYDNTASGLTATNVQAAIDKVSEHPEEQGGIHGIPEGERAVHTGEMLRRGNSETISYNDFEIPVNSSVQRDEPVVILLASRSSDNFNVNHSQTFVGQIRISSNAAAGRARTVLINVTAHASTGDRQHGTVSFEGLGSFERPYEIDAIACDFNGGRYVGVRIDGAVTDFNSLSAFNPFLDGILYGDDDPSAPRPEVVRLADCTNITPSADTDGPFYGGRPGDIVESGSNSNGHYVRWENGEQFCWRSTTVDMTDTRRYTRDYPAVFSIGPAVWYASGNEDGAGGRRDHQSLFSGSLADSALRSSSSSEHTESWNLARSPDPDASTAAPIMLYAWGFWK